MQAKLSAEELGEAFNQVAYGCREPEVEHLARIQDHIAALTAERDQAQETIIEMIAGRYTVSEVITALVKAGFK